KEAVAQFRTQLEESPGEALALLPVRYNLAQALFLRSRYHEALVEFKLCRSVYPFYRDVLFYVDLIRATLSGGPGRDPDPAAAAMRIPRYSIVRAVAGR
ncbi:MAG: hypothetical protein AB1758_37480, partial [Candidatus Eremiobacterota bacterium]